jgi:hypothetical protein
MHANNNEKNKKPLQATRGVFLSCSPEEHNEFTTVIAKAQMEKPILKFRNLKCWIIKEVCSKVMH